MRYGGQQNASSPVILDPHGHAKLDAQIAEETQFRQPTEAVQLEGGNIHDAVNDPLDEAPRAVDGLVEPEGNTRAWRRQFEHSSQLSQGFSIIGERSLTAEMTQQGVVDEPRPILDRTRRVHGAE